MNENIIFDYGEEGRIIATETESEIFDVYAKAKLDGIPCTGGSMADEGPPMGCCGT